VRNPGITQLTEYSRDEVKDPEEGAYFLDDGEFQTWVTNGIRILESLFREFPSSEHKSVFNYMLGSGSVSVSLEEKIRSLVPQAPLRWYVQLRRRNPAKWRAAVKYVYKELF